MLRQTFLALLLSISFILGCDDDGYTGTDAGLDMELDVPRPDVRDAAPSPDTKDMGPVEQDLGFVSGCVHCHRPNGEGIETAHPFEGAELSCVDCHGGDPNERVDPQKAHPRLPEDLGAGMPPSCEDPSLDRLAQAPCEHRSDCNATGNACDRETNRCLSCDEAPCDNWLTCSPSGVCCLDYRGIRRLSTDQIDKIPDEVIQFINPGDHRVAHKGCGSSNGKANGGSCHQEAVDQARLSVMETFTGHYNLSRFLAGMQSRTAEVGTVDRESPITNDEAPDVLRTAEISALRGATVSPDEDFVSAAMDTYLVQNCPYCHTASFGRNNDLRNYRSSGCTACHMTYDADGLSKTRDPTADLTEPGHPIQHTLTNQIPTSQCEHCHFQGARIGLTYQGVREGKFNEAPEDKAAHEPWKQTPVHGNPNGAYYAKEKNDPFDTLTPPDIHCRRPGEDGDDCRMDCADCHTTRAVHGDGKLYSTAKGQVDIQCTDCHGTVRTRAIPDEGGAFRTQHGTPLDQLERDDEGLWLTTKRTGERLKVTQIADLVAERCDEENRDLFSSFCDAMAPNVGGVSHTDSMECWTCHSTWRMNCFGCHITYNNEIPRQRVRNEQTGEYMRAVVGASRQFFDIEMIILGTNQRGMIDTMCPSMQFFFTRKEDRVRVIDQEARRAADGRVGFGWMPNNQHTIGRGAKPCTDCHPKEDETNLGKVRETFGYGNPDKQYWVASRTGEPRREGGYKCSDNSACPEGMACLNPCPDNVLCDTPETPRKSAAVNRRCATICRSNDDCDAPAVCVRRLDPDDLRGPVEILRVPNEAGDSRGLCVFDLTQMVYEDGSEISPNAHEDTGPVSRERYERALSNPVP